jgi:transcriptional regulator with XRE-family HTH domain
MTPQETFVIRLRRHRQRHRVSLEEIATDLKVKPELLEALERNDLSEWPRGLYARAWIRAYASTVGLDATDTVDEFCRLFPQGDRRVQPTIEEIANIVAHQSEYRHEVSPERDRRRGPDVNMLPKLPWHVAALTTAIALCRALWARAASLMPVPHTRHKRQPHVS